MKKRHNLTKILSMLGMCILLTGCTMLAYVDDDADTIKSTSVQTSENFNVQAFEKTTEGVIVRAGISETVLDSALVLYMQIRNDSDVSFKFDTDDINVTSPIGEVTFLTPSSYIEAYQNFEAANYAGMANASATIGQFASLQNQYRRTVSNPQNTLEATSSNITPELLILQKTIEGIQRHSLTSYKFVEPKSSDYFYVFLRKPEEYPIVVKYKDLTYKFGTKKNVKN